VFGEEIANRIIWKLVYTFGGYAITKSFCSIFPLREIITAPDFDKAIDKAKKDYLSRGSDATISIPGYDKWLKGGGF